MKALSERIAANPQGASSIGAIYKFLLSGDGGGIWLVNLKDDVGVTPTDGEAECTFSLAAEDFIELMDNPSIGQQLFFSGKLQIDGDIGLALKLQQLAEL